MIMIRPPTRAPHAAARRRAAAQSSRNKGAEAFDKFSMGIGISGGAAIVLVIGVFLPRHFLLIAATTILFGIGAAVHGLLTARRYMKGAHSELKVAEALAPLEQSGAVVIHDLLIGRANIDHVVVAPGGVYVIETKHIRKLKTGENRIVRKGDALLLNGAAPLAGAPLEQATRNAETVRSLLANAFADVPVRAVLIPAGWYVDGAGPKDGPWVLNETAFPKWVVKDPAVLSADQIRRIAGLLAKFDQHEEPFL